MIQFNEKKNHYYIKVNNFKIIINEGEKAFNEEKIIYKMLNQ